VRRRLRGVSPGLLRDLGAAALATHQLTAGYGDVPVIHGVDLAVREGQLVAVVGPNGAGKSTLLKAILGLARVMGGRVLADGRDITGRPLDQLVRLGVGYVPQVDDVFDPLKVSENLNVGGYLLGKADRIARMEEVLAIFPALRSRLNRYVGTMSGGERKMTAIARALMLSPRVLVLDEPTAGLSAVLTESVLARPGARAGRPGACGAVSRTEGPGRPAARRHRVGAGAGAGGDVGSGG
jgi:ABC-type branched-subunit amino acid transport system ATPase component